VGNEANDDPSKDFPTVSGTETGHEDLRPCKLYDDDDDEDDDDDDPQHT
jgi:hypothetical protein